MFQYFNSCLSFNGSFFAQHLFTPFVVQIRDGGTMDSPVVGSFCGTTVPPDYVSTTNQVHIEFHSDWSSTGQGFLLNWEATSDNPITTQAPTAATSPGTFYWIAQLVKCLYQVQEIPVFDPHWLHHTKDEISTSCFFAWCSTVQGRTCIFFQKRKILMAMDFIRTKVSRVINIVIRTCFTIHLK